MKSRFNDHGLCAPSAVRELLEYCAGFVTESDVIEFSPRDPGYENYVRVWTAVINTGIVPAQRYDFDLCEVISLTNWSKAELAPDPIRFLRFRCLTCATGLVVLSREVFASDLPLNYLLIRLLQDQAALNEDLLLSHLLAAIPAVGEVLKSPESRHPEYPFCCLATILLRLQAEARATSLEAAAEELIEEEQNVRGWDVSVESPTFLFGLTPFNQMETEWQEVVNKVIPVDLREGNLALVRSELTASLE